MLGNVVVLIFQLGRDPALLKALCAWLASESPTKVCRYDCMPELRVFGSAACKAMNSAQGINFLSKF